MKVFCFTQSKVYINNIILFFFIYLQIVTSMNKLAKIGRIFAFAALIGIIAVVSSCSEKEDPVDNKLGTVTGTVTDETTGDPVAGVSVAISNVEGTATTGSDGKYTVANVSIESHTVTFTKTGWQEVSVSIAATKFDANKTAVVNASMINASAKIIGTITDAKNANAPLSGVNVSIQAVKEATSGNDGKYVLDNLVADDFTVTFSKANYVTITRAIKRADFIDGTATVDVEMGGSELLREKTYADLLTAEKWFFNEYRGGRNADAYPHWDWACNYMCTLDFWGNWEEQNEGTTLRIRNDEDQRGNPADLDVFDSYVYGSKMITADNKILSLRVRTHAADADAPAHFGVQVIDLAAAAPAAVKIGGTKTYGSGDYSDFDFDLSSYVGKEVVIAIGIYRKETGDYWKQLVLRAIRFADRRVEGWDWLPGTDVVDGWKLTKETVRSTMPNPLKSFTGVSPEGGNRDNYVGAYRSWRTVNHIATGWSFVPLKKDPEVFPSEGYLIKTRGNEAINTQVPEAYFYAKFAIASGNNKFTLKTRNFGSEYTFFKLTAIKEDGSVTHLTPISNTAETAEAAADGCWKFKHGKGGAGEPEEYASFIYDLASFNGNNVVLALGVYNGEVNGDENKLVIYSINLD